MQIWGKYIFPHTWHIGQVGNVSVKHDIYVSYIAATCMQRNNTYHGCDHMVVGFTTTCAISIYHH
jgi:hypothetical protein